VSWTFLCSLNAIFIWNVPAAARRQRELDLEKNRRMGIARAATKDVDEMKYAWPLAVP